MATPSINFQYIDFTHAAQAFALQKAAQDLQAQYMQGLKAAQNISLAPQGSIQPSIQRLNPTNYTTATLSGPTIFTQELSGGMLCGVLNPIDVALEKQVDKLFKKLHKSCAALV
jgi:hypothetical protein